MRILATCSLGGAGHLRPLLPLLEAARLRGDDILMVGPSGLGMLMGRTGLPFRTGGEPPEAMVAPVREQLAVVPAAQASVLANRHLFANLATRALLPAVEDAVRTFGPELLVREPCEFAAAVVARRSAVPVAQVAISFAEAEWGSLGVASPALERHEPGLTDAARATPYLTAFPASLDPSPFPYTVRLRPGVDVSYPGIQEPEPLPTSWWPSALAGAPLVLASFGTVAGHLEGAGSLYRTAAAALAAVPARVLLTIGDRLDPDLLGAVAPSIHVEHWVDQERVLPSAALVVCHGGSGTTFGALATGVPVVMLPLFADQRENARRVVDRGAGLAVAPPTLDATGGPVRKAEAARIREAVLVALVDEDLRVGAGLLADEMRRAPPSSDVLARWEEPPGPAG